MQIVGRGTYKCTIIVPQTDDDIERARDLNLGEPPADEMEGMVDLNEISFFHREPAHNELIWLDMKNGNQLLIRADFVELSKAFATRAIQVFYFSN